MLIRKIMEEDAAAFLKMLTQLDTETKNMMYEPGERPQNLDRVRNNIITSAESGGLLLCAILDNELVGFLSAGRGALKRIHHSAYLVIGILSKGQSKGLGSKLFDELFEWAKNENIVRLELTVMCHNEVAISLYKKFGFEVEGIKRKSLMVEGNYVDEYYMSRIL